MTDTRVDWHTYFMNIARQVSSRSTCPRKHVGAVIVRDKTILSTGYNGSIRGLPHCSDVGCVIEDGHCVSTVHAEANAIIQAAKNGVAIDGAELYTTASPCWPCFKLIANSGIKRVYFGEFYRDERSIQVAKNAGIELVDLSVVGGEGLRTRAAVQPPAGLPQTGASPSARIRRHSSRWPFEAAESWKNRQPSPRSPSLPSRTTRASATIVRTPRSTGTSKETSSLAPTGWRTGVRTKNPPRERSRIVPECCRPSLQNVIDHSTADRASSRGMTWRKRRSVAKNASGSRGRGSVWSAPARSA